MSQLPELVDVIAYKIFWRKYKYVYTRFMGNTSECQRFWNYPYLADRAATKAYRLARKHRAKYLNTWAAVFTESN